MATITIKGRAFELAPYMIGSMRRAAPFVDRINARAGTLATLEHIFENGRDLCEVVAIGLGKIEPAMTADAIEDQLGFEDMMALAQAYKEIMREAGFAPKGDAPGEAEAPSGPAPGEALPIS